MSQRLGPFQVLVGPNASGKSTFLDVLAFLGDLQRVGLERAVAGDASYGIPLRAANPQHLTWMRSGKTFELAVEAIVPGDLGERLTSESTNVCRYEIKVEVTGLLRIATENLWLKSYESKDPERERLQFPDPPEPPERVVLEPKQRAPAGWRRVMSRGGKPDRVTFYPGTSRRPIRFYVEADKSALVNLPADEEFTAVAAWFREMLSAGIQRIALSSETMRRTSPPARSDLYLPDGSNLPHIVDAVARQSPDRYADWMKHIREALPDIERLTVRHATVGWTSLPDWFTTAADWKCHRGSLSDGTVRFLALTLLAYLPKPHRPLSRRGA